MRPRTVLPVSVCPWDPVRLTWTAAIPRIPILSLSAPAHSPARTISSAAVSADLTVKMAVSQPMSHVTSYLVRSPRRFAFPPGPLPVAKMIIVLDAMRLSLMRLGSMNFVLALLKQSRRRAPRQWIAPRTGRSTAPKEAARPAASAPPMRTVSTQKTSFL